MTEPDKDYDRIAKAIRLDRMLKRKRLYEQANRARRSKTVDASKDKPDERA